MRKSMAWTVAGIVLVVAMLGLVKFMQIRSAIKAGSSWQPPPETVTTVVASIQDWSATIEAVGSAAPARGVTLAADLPGVVQSIFFQSGAYVREGQELVVLDTRQERGQLHAAIAQRDLARNNLERGRKLLEQQAISKLEFDQTEAASRQSEALVEQAEAAIGRKTIRAPFSGVTGIRQVNLGQYVNSGDAIVPLHSLDPMYVNFTVPQQDAAVVRTGAVVVTLADSSSTGRFTGRVTTVNPLVAEATRNVEVQATFPNPRGQMRAGMFVTVQVQVGASRPTVAVPASAINYAPYGNSVFVVEQIKGPNGKSYRGVRQQFVKLGGAQGDQVAVVQGVTPGQEIVTTGVFKLRSGAAVNVDNKTLPSNSLSPRPANS
jgi:membrane fusion protein (multidrug efflux system)